MTLNGRTREGVERALARLAHVDILVNNLGIYKPFFDIPDSDWLRFFETNVLSGVRSARHYAPAMWAQAGVASSSSPARARSTSRAR